MRFYNVIVGFVLCITYAASEFSSIGSIVRGPTHRTGSSLLSKKNSATTAEQVDAAGATAAGIPHDEFPASATAAKFRNCLRYRGGAAADGASASTSGTARSSPIISAKVRGGGHEVDEHGDPPGEMGVGVYIINLVADICAHGMLPVAFGMAAAGGTGLITAPAVLAVFGAISVYTLVSLGRACQWTKKWSYSGLWADLVSPKTAWIVEVAVAVMTFGCCVFYAAFAGDLFGSLAASVDFLPPFFRRRAVVLSCISLFPLLPLCLMKNLAALQYTSFGGVIAILYTAFFVMKRGIDGSYHEGGQFYLGVDEHYRSPEADPWKMVGLWKVGPGLITLMNMSCVAFMAHYNGVKYYEELKDRTVKKYWIGTGTAMGIALLVFWTMMLFGFKTFGTASQALILNNYHRSEDKLAQIARLACGCAITCGYPLMFAALKTSFFNAGHEILAKFESYRPLSLRFLNDKTLQVTCAVTLQAIITAIACNESEEDVAFVVGLIGALLGSAANYIIPAVLNLKLFKRRNVPSGLLSETSANKLLVVCGFFFGVLGTVKTFKDNSVAHHHPHHH